MIALMFPGQGSQSIGMCKDFYDDFLEAKNVFEKADDILNRKLSKIIFEGSEDDLRDTRNAQLAIVVSSIAIYEVIKSLLSKKNVNHIDLFSHALGHSVGEYSALYAAEVLSFEDIIRLVNKRAQLMGDCSEGGMIALLGSDIESCLDLCKKISLSSGEICEISNDNNHEQIVVSGGKNAIQGIMESAKDFGVKKAIILNVSGPFHSSILDSIQKPMLDEILKYPISYPRLPIISNVTANVVTDPRKIGLLLSRQVCSKVRWRESVSMVMTHGYHCFLEIGYGNVLSKILKKIDPKAVSLPISEVSSLDKLETLLGDKLL